jgi:multidrug efflux pump subunit AcrB
VTVSGLSRRDGVPVEISRTGGHRAVYVSANVGEGSSLGAATDAIQAEARALPAGVRLELGGDSEQAATVLASFAPAIGFAVLCIVAVLAGLFRSWVEPLVIALALPLSTAGAMLGLFVARSDFGMISLLGLVFLLGLVNKNAILLVDCTRQLEARGLDRRAAILAAGPMRLRPILMTTAATILGMLPIALGLGAGAELRAPMAVAIIGGLATSTLLSLLVVPVGYSLLHELRVPRSGQNVR